MTTTGFSDTLRAMPRRRSPGTLQAFLEHPARPAGTLGYHALQGFLFAVVNAPELVLPSEWLPLVFDEQDASFGSVEEAKAILGEIMTLYNAVNAAAREESALPTDCVFRDDVLANFGDGAPIAQWSRGFLHGHGWLDEVWEAYVPDALDEEYAATLMVLSFFASRNLAEGFCAECTGPDQSVETMAAAMRRVFPAAVAQYMHMGRSIATVLAQRETDPQQSSPTKAGRNDPCPCGSGQKYKKCCGATVH